MIYLLIVSIIINVLFVIPLIWQCVLKRKPNYIKKEISDEKLLHLIASSSLTNKRKLMVFYEPTGTILDYLQLLRPRGREIVNNFQNSYLLFGLTSYALAYGRQDVLQCVIDRINSFLNSKNELSYPLIRLDQVPFGMTLILLQKYATQDYSSAINQIYNFLLDRYAKDGSLLYIRGSKFQHVDSLGMYVPFLSLYSKQYGDSKSLEMIRKGLEEYDKYGVDYNTGIPAHGYNLDSKIKIGSINWGRGLGWYLLGLSFVEDEGSHRVDEILPNLPLEQFPGQTSEFDSSTAIMTKIYIFKKRLYENGAELSLDFIKPFISKDGHVGNCSGDTYTYNRYSNAFGPSELCDGLLLYLGSLLKEYANCNRNSTIDE